MARLGDLFPEDVLLNAGLPPTPINGAPPQSIPPKALAAVAAKPASGRVAPSRTNVKDLAAGQDVEGIYLVSEATIRAAKNGSKYVQATLCDKTGTIPARQWDVNEAAFEEYRQGGYVKIRGRVELYKNAMQLIVFAALNADDEKVNPADFIPVSVRPLDEMECELDALLATFADPDYKCLLETIFADTEIRAKFIKNPAAASVHHAWCGGLIEHVLSACKTAQSIAEQRPFLDRDLLLTGVILHDIGKIEEIDAGPGFNYTDSGRLCGHIVLGALLVERNILKLENFPRKKRDLILHMILSHHGELEYGSPVKPYTMEAVALHHLECLDAKVQGIQSIIEREHASGNDGAWSEFARVVDGRIYKG